jgi:hypothetical protein
VPWTVGKSAQDVRKIMIISLERIPAKLALEKMDRKERESALKR